MTEADQGIPTGRAAELASAGFAEMPDPLAKKRKAGLRARETPPLN